MKVESELYHKGLEFLKEAHDLIRGRARIMAKLEKPAALQTIEEIITLSDGIMVARGDLGIEIGDPQLPAVQKKLIKLARSSDKVVITATQMLESMIANPIATILSLSMALRYSLDLEKEADQIDKAVQSVLDEGLRTKDIMSKNMKEVSTTNMGDAIIAKLK